MISFILAAGHHVAGVLLTTNANDFKWFYELSLRFVNKDDPEKIRNAITAGSVSLSRVRKTDF